MPEEQRPLTSTASITLNDFKVENSANVKTIEKTEKVSETKAAQTSIDNDTSINKKSSKKTIHKSKVSHRKNLDTSTHRFKKKSIANQFSTAMIADRIEAYVLNPLVEQQSIKLDITSQVINSVVDSSVVSTKDSLQNYVADEVGVPQNTEVSIEAQQSGTSIGSLDQIEENQSLTPLETGNHIDESAIIEANHVSSTDVSTLIVENSVDNESNVTPSVNNNKSAQVKATATEKHLEKSLKEKIEPTQLTKAIDQTTKPTDNELITVRINLQKSTNVEVSYLDQDGKVMKNSMAFTGLSQGIQQLTLDTSVLEAGTYQININDTSNSKTLKTMRYIKE